jgi:hypothetical protein
MHRYSINKAKNGDFSRRHTTVRVTSKINIVRLPNNPMEARRSEKNNKEKKGLLLLAQIQVARGTVCRVAVIH